MSRRATSAGGALILAATLAAAAQANAAGAEPTGLTTLHLSAFGEVEAAPDQATITLGVQTKAGAAAKAMSDDDAQMNLVFAALRKAGLPDKDIQTSDLSLNAQYDYPPGQPPQLGGYQASDTVTVTVRDLSRLGTVIDAAVSAGANQVEGISFGLKDPAIAQDEARRIAVAALSRRAALYADAMGLKVARLADLSESGEASAPIRPMMMRQNVSAAATPVSPGQLTVRIDVSATYELTK